MLDMIYYVGIIWLDNYKVTFSHCILLNSDFPVAFASYIPTYAINFINKKFLQKYLCTKIIYCYASVYIFRFHQNVAVHFYMLVLIFNILIRLGETLFGKYHEYCIFFSAILLWLLYLSSLYNIFFIYYY